MLIDKDPTNRRATEHDLLPKQMHFALGFTPRNGIEEDYPEQAARMGWSDDMAGNRFK